MADRPDRGTNPPADDAAIALTLLGDELAPLVLRYMDDAAVAALTARIGEGLDPDLDQAAQILDRLATALDTTQAGFPGGMDYLRRVLVNAFGDAKATEITDAILHASRETFDILANADPQILARQMADEPPQVLAAMLGVMKRSAACAFLNTLPEDKMSDVLFRYSQLEFVRPTALAELRHVLSELLAGRDLVQTETFGGVRQAADLLNAMDADLSERALTGIRAVDSALAQDIRDNLFIFDDLSRLGDQTLQMVLREVDQDALAHALRAAAPTIRDRIFANVSQKQMAVLKDDLENGRPITRAEARAAQRAVTAAAIRLAEAGRLSLAGAADML